jgi:hypothetical protein
LLRLFHIGLKEKQKHRKEDKVRFNVFKKKRVKKEKREKLESASKSKCQIISPRRLRAFTSMPLTLVA